MVRGSERYLSATVPLTSILIQKPWQKLVINSAVTAKMFGIDPKIAMLELFNEFWLRRKRYKVVQATKLVHDLRPD